MDTWIHREILDGMTKLLCLGLERTPAADMIAGTSMAWHEAITHKRVWDESLDSPRFRQAFATLAKTRRTWPAPVDFLDVLPPRNQQSLTKQPIVSAPDSPHIRQVMEQIGSMLKMR